MGIENANFRVAAEQLRVGMPSARTLADDANEFIRNTRTNGSPIGAAADQIADEKTDTPTDGASFAPGPKFDDFIGLVLGDIVGRAEAKAAEQEAELADQAAAEAFNTAQSLDMMSAGAEGMSDELEMEGLDETAGYLRAAAKLVRKAARSARAAGREAIAVSDETDA